MPKQYIIENGGADGFWLKSVNHREPGDLCTYGPELEEAILFKKAEALAFARKWHARVWRVRGGVPVKRVEG